MAVLQWEVLFGLFHHVQFKNLVRLIKCNLASFQVSPQYTFHATSSKYMANKPPWSIEKERAKHEV